MQYTKKMSYGATLYVEQEKWHIKMETQGPDTRYRKKPFYLTEDNMEEYFSQLIQNFETYEQLKKVGKTTLTKGKGNHWIRFGLGEGVCLYEKEYPIKKREVLEQWIEEIINSVQEVWKFQGKDKNNDNLNRK